MGGSSCTHRSKVNKAGDLGEDVALEGTAVKEKNTRQG